MQSNKIYLGDCLDLITELPDGCVDAVITDPPYHQGLTHNGQKTTLDDLNICKPFFRQLLKEIKRVLKSDGFLYWFCDWRGYPFYYPLIKEFVPIKNLLVWDKHNGRVSFCYMSAHEFIVFCCKDKSNITKSNVIKVRGFAAGNISIDGAKVHPTQKPTKLISELICDCTQEGDLVLDCFAGSCTTAVSAIRERRNFICFELQEQYFEIGNKRVEDAMQGFNICSEEVIGSNLF